MVVGLDSKIAIGTRIEDDNALLDLTFNGIWQRAGKSRNIQHARQWIQGRAAVVRLPHRGDVIPTQPKVDGQFRA